MKTKLISDIQNNMKPFLNQGQYLKLTKTLLNLFKDIEIIEKKETFDLSDLNSNKKIVKSIFISKTC